MDKYSCLLRTKIMQAIEKDGEYEALLSVYEFMEEEETKWVAETRVQNVLFKIIETTLEIVGDER